MTGPSHRSFQVIVDKESKWTMPELTLARRPGALRYRVGQQPYPKLGDGVGEDRDIPEVYHEGCRTPT